MDTANFRKYAAVYRLFNQEKDYAAECDYLAWLFQKFGAPGRSILDLGSGTGEHAVEFAKRGFEVRGIERSADMAGIARERGVDCEVGDIRSTSLGRQFDAVVSLFHVMSYLTENEDLERCFQLSYNHLKPGGLFIFDAWYSDAVRHQKPERREKTVHSDGIEVRRVAEPEQDETRNTVTVHYDFSIRLQLAESAVTWKEVHPMRHFSIQEIETLSHHTGFQLLKAEEFVTGAPPSDQTWGVCYILKK